MIFRVNILTTATVRDEQRECKLLSQVQNFNNRLSLNIISEQKSAQQLIYWNHRLI